jgi:sigma-B regulation protein RsbU (phosphoserine phosphatase)
MTRKQLLNGKLNQDPEVLLNLKQLELSALLEVTEAINGNLPEDALYKIYHFTLITNLHINKLALFVNDDAWLCKVSYGCSETVRKTDIGKEIADISKITTARDFAGFEMFDVIIPISHKGKNLAFVFVGGVNELDLEDADSVLSFVQTLTSIIIVAIENKRLARRQLQQEALKKELEIASKVQSNLFPLTLPHTDSLLVKASYLPNLVVGGDYYDYIELAPGKFLICIADVSGKGIPAALLMSSFQAGLKTLLRRTHDLHDILTELNILVKNSAKGERFITFFAAVVDRIAGTLTYVNAGHNPPIFITGKNARLLEKGSTILGVFDELPFVESESLPLCKSGLIFTYTDGVTETADEEDQEYGLERLQDFLLAFDYSDAERLHDHLLRELTLFKGKKSFPDDVTFLSCLLR